MGNTDSSNDSSEIAKYMVSLKNFDVETTENHCSFGKVGVFHGRDGYRGFKRLIFHDDDQVELYLKEIERYQTLLETNNPYLSNILEIKST